MLDRLQLLALCATLYSYTPGRETVCSTKDEMIVEGGLCWGTLVDSATRRHANCILSLQALGPFEPTVVQTTNVISTLPVLTTLATDRRLRTTDTKELQALPLPYLLDAVTRVVVLLGY